MDPNETLARLRTLADRIIAKGVFSASGESVFDDCEELATTVEAMDAWLKKGGFLPDAWAKSRKRVG